MSFTEDQLARISDEFYDLANSLSMRNARAGITRADWKDWEERAWGEYIEVAKEADRQLDELEGVDTA